MPRIISLLFVCNFFQLHVYAFYPYFTDSFYKKLYNCEEWSQCSNNRSIPISFICNGLNDCVGYLDEKICPHKLINLSNITCDEDEYKCKDGNCIPLMKFCDTRIDCPDKSDEIDDCVKDLKCDGRFLCQDKHCILNEWVCDGRPDCPDGSDELNCTSECKQIDSSNGTKCFCQQGYKLFDTHECIDIDECQTDGICDQECINTRGSYRCDCKTGFILRDDKKTCETDDTGLVVFSLKENKEIHIISHDFKYYFPPIRNISATNIATDENYIYWSSELNQMIMRIDKCEKREVVIQAGFRQLSGLAVDWITNNIYFVDQFYEHIGVCDNKGMYCTILIKRNELAGITLLPANGTMYLSTGGKSPHIAMAGMDGNNVQIIISKNLKCPQSMTIDYLDSRLYWINENKIESSYLDGTDRKVILQDVVKYPITITVFKNKLYWGDSRHKTIQSCDKFSGKDWNILAKMNDVPHSLHIDHSAIKPKIPNPCLSKPCSELCLLNQNKHYTCACASNKKLNTDNTTCRETEKQKHFIIFAGNTIINYYHGMLGNPNVTVSNVTKHFTAVTCDSLSGTILASDQSTNQIVRYNPITGDIKSLFPIETKTLGGMAFDHIGNNLYLSNVQNKSIEVHSLTTKEKTVFYFKQRPYNIALVPEKCEMHIILVFKNFYMCTMNMNGIGEKKIFDGAIWPFMKDIYLFESSNEYHVQDFRKMNILSIASNEDFLYWTKYNSNLLYYVHTGSSNNSTMIALHMPVTVKKPLVSSLYRIVIHEKYGCQDRNGNCSHVCLPSSNTSFICACPPEMMLSAKDNLTCVFQTSCPNNKIKCSKHDICIKKEQWCDGNEDCPNGEDEQDGCKEIGKCGKGQFLCENGVCINWINRCNSQNNCGDNSDEKNCCRVDQYECQDKTCISSSLVCNGQFDCPDSSDEFFIYCSNHTCPPEKFKCAQGKCIPKEWLCDGEYDCLSGEDERNNCTSANLSDEKYFTSNQHCISSSLKCNGIDDNSGDNSDEICLKRVDAHYSNCTKDEYNCLNTDTCLPKSMRCNGVSDCPKNDDEYDCSFCEDLFTCDNRKYIPQNWVCDQYDDCKDGSDEKNCGSHELRNINITPSVERNEFKCSNGTSLPFTKICNNFTDCMDFSDEGGKCGVSCISENPCTQRCYKTPLGPICGCQDGYRLATDNRTCNDIDECEQNDICSQICRNTMGSFTCACYEGYNIRNDRVSCKATGEPMQIITVTDDDIRKITPNLKLLEAIYSLKGLQVTSLDVNAMNDSVYWSNDKIGSINKFNIKTNVSSIMIKDVGNPDTLAVDWITNNIYINNNGDPNTIKVCNLDLNKCAVVVEINSTARVSVLILDPGNRWLFWSQVTWEMDRTPSSEIYRTDMMGAAKKKIIFHNIDLVNGMAIDYMKSRLYWSDSLRNIIESCNLDGTQRRTFLTSYKHRPLGINIYENSLYWLMGSSGVLQKCKIYNNESCTTINIGATNVHKHFAILQISRHPAMKNPCRDLHCDYMCVLSANNGRNATCINQMTNLSDDKSVDNNSNYTKNMVQVNGTIQSFTMKNNVVETYKNTWQLGSSYNTIMITLLIAIVLLCTYSVYYYQRRKFRRLNGQSFHFYNPFDDQDEIAIALDSATDQQSDLSPELHEHVNPMNDSLHNRWPKAMGKNNTNRSGETSKQWEEEFEETEK